ncbi:MAG TPA: hypothetical protein VGK49_03265 [Ilumatobacteraceae bacterium]
MYVVGERFEIELEEAPTRGSRRARSTSTPAPVLTSQQAPPPPSEVFGPRLMPLDTEPVEPPASDDTAAERRRAIVVGAGVAVGLTLVVAGFALGRSTGTNDDGAGEVASATSTVAPSTTESALERGAEALPGVGRVGSPRDATTTTEPAAITTLDLGRPLLPAPFGQELVGLTVDGHLMELNPDTGVATLTDVPIITGGDPLVYAGSSGTLVFDPYQGSAWWVPRGGEPERWSTRDGVLGGGMAPMPGPSDDTAWFGNFFGADGRIRLQLMTLAGDAVGEPIPIETGYPTLPDGRGGVLVTAPGGTYRIGVDGTRRLTTGNVVASGPGGLVVVDCDELLVCSASLLDPSSGAQRPVDSSLVGPLSNGGWFAGFPAVAPDGGAMALYRYTEPDPGFALIDLATGLATVLTENMGPWGSFGWSNDSRFGLYLDDGKLFYVDRPLRTYLPVHEELPRLRYFTTRPIAPPAQSG